MALPVDGQQFKNRIEEGEMAFGAVTAGFLPFVNFSDDILFNHLSIQCTFDQQVELRFNNVDTITIEPNEAVAMDGFVHGWEIDIRHSGVAPTVGYLKTRSW